MGMFNDNVGVCRTGWTYKYKGSELLPFAEKLHNEFYQKEAEARSRMATYMTDMKMSRKDEKVINTEKDIDNFGRLKEQCSVFRHEFSRNPNREYDLGLGDVTFFELNV